MQMTLIIRYKIIAIIALILLIPTTKALAETEYHPLAGCYSVVGEEKVYLQVAQKGDDMYMTLGVKKDENIFNKQLLAHEMDRQELSKAGFKAEEIDKFASNVFLNRRSDVFVGVIQIVPGEIVNSFERLPPPNFKKGSDYFAFLGMFGAWVTKVDCMEGIQWPSPDKVLKRDATLTRRVP